MGQNMGMPQNPMGGMGPMQEAVAVNAPTPQMLNMARGQDPTANGFGDIRPQIGKPGGMPQAPRMQAGGSGPTQGGIPMMLAQLLSRGGK